MTDTNAGTAAIAVARAYVARSMEPFRDRLSHDDFEALVQEAIEILCTHPASSSLVDVLRVRPTMAQSGDVATETDTTDTLEDVG